MGKLSSRAMPGVVALLLSISGCASVPDVSDYSGVDSYNIVKRLRCELRDAVRVKAKEAIARRHPALAASLVEDEDFLRFDLAQLGDEASFLVQLYSNTLVGYDFSFDITENNNANANVDILHTLTRGALGFGIGVTNNRERNTTESFRTLDSFGKLATGVSNEYCGTDRQHPVNYAYPITGKLNLIRYVKNFLDLNQSGNLADAAEKNISSYKIFLKFTTKVGGHIAPDLDLTPLKEGWELTGVDGKLEGVRQDVHQVTIVFVLPSGSDMRGDTIAERRVKEELDYLRQRDDLRFLRTGN